MNWGGGSLRLGDHRLGVYERVQNQVSRRRVEGQISGRHELVGGQVQGWLYESLTG